MSFWGALQETIIDGAAGAVGTFAPTGYAEVGAAAIHGVGAAINGAKGEGGLAAVELGSAGAAAVPSVGRYAGLLDLGQAGYNAVATYDNATGGHMETSGDHIVHGAESLWDRATGGIGEWMGGADRAIRGLYGVP
jgi:hypothetical protein